MRRDVIQVVPYNNRWPKMFLDEKDRLSLILTKIGAKQIEHIGSTSVPNLAAKPTIDILIGVDNLSIVDQHIKDFKQQGYNYIKSFEKNYPFRRYFRMLKNSKHLFHLHIVEKNNDYYNYQIVRRDYLRTHPDEIKKYAKLKRKLAKEFIYNREGYTIAKNAFIGSLTIKAVVWDTIIRNKT